MDATCNNGILIGGLFILLGLIWSLYLSASYKYLPKWITILIIVVILMDVIGGIYIILNP